jgi:hypothetical protein
VKRLDEIFKPEEFCKSLGKGEMAVFNIPLDVNEQDIIIFLKKEHGVEAKEVSIARCVLNLNSFAVVKVEPAQQDEVVAKLHRKRFKGCLLEVKTNKDAESESAFNRTLVITNFDKGLTA